jgi:hypothetical protein
MYLLVTVPILHALFSLRAHSNEEAIGKKAKSSIGSCSSGLCFVVTYIALNTFLGWLLVVVPIVRRQLFSVLVLAAIAAEHWARRCIPERARLSNVKALNVGVAIFFLAFFIWNLDIRRIVCSADSLLQGHAAWHILCALASFFIFVYYHDIVFQSAPKSQLPK